MLVLFCFSPSCQRKKDGSQSLFTKHATEGEEEGGKRDYRWMGLKDLKILSRFTSALVVFLLWKKRRNLPPEKAKKRKRTQTNDQTQYSRWGGKQVATSSCPFGFFSANSHTSHRLEGFDFFSRFQTFRSTVITRTGGENRDKNKGWDEVEKWNDVGERRLCWELIRIGRNGYRQKKEEEKAEKKSYDRTTKEVECVRCVERGKEQCEAKRR